MDFSWKIMRLNSEQRWGAYKKVVAESLDKALELFSTKKFDATLHLDHQYKRPSLSYNKPRQAAHGMKAKINNKNGEKMES
jgi:hypothetical protein